jgi:hypothetical protein
MPDELSNYAGRSRTARLARQQSHQSQQSQSAHPAPVQSAPVRD